MPLPFWILGGSQILWGRNLLAARLTGLGLGLGALALVALIARQMAGDLRAGSLDPQGGRSCALWQRLLGRSASESGFYVFYAPLSWPASRSASRSRPLAADRPGPIANGCAKARLCRPRPSGAMPENTLYVGSGFWGGQRLESRRLRHGDGVTRGQPLPEELAEVVNERVPRETDRFSVKLIRESH
jgi:hypothetical protein